MTLGSLSQFEKTIISQSVEKIHPETFVNSLGELEEFLRKNNMKEIVIATISQSFMAKIPAGTHVQIIDNMLHVGESRISLGTNFLREIAGTKALIENMQNRAIKILDQNLPMVPPKRVIATQPNRSIATANDKTYTQVA